MFSRRVIKTFILFVFVLFVFQKNSFTESTGNISGSVIDAETKEPIPNINVYINNAYDINGRKISSMTNDKGEFEFTKLSIGFRYELEILVLEHPTDIDFKYYRQIYRIPIILQKGKNVCLKPVEIKRGVKITGYVKLWDGTPISKARLSIYLKKGQIFDSVMNYFDNPVVNENGHFTSLPLPPEVELVLSADCLRDTIKNVSYGSVEFTIILQKSDNLKNIDIVIPNITTEIKGKVVNKNGLPLINQEIEISLKRRTYAITDNNGYFVFKHINPGNIKIRIVHEDNKFIKFFRTKSFILDLGESIWIDIVLDENDYFRYTILKNTYK